MTKTMTFTSLPMGPCGACIEAMADLEQGQTAIHLALGGGFELWGIYCEHTRAGAHCIVGPGRPARWVIDTPIPFHEWIDSMKRIPGAFAAVRAAMHNEPPVDPPPN